MTGRGYPSYRFAELMKRIGCAPDQSKFAQRAKAYAQQSMVVMNGLKQNAKLRAKKKEAANEGSS